MEKEPYESQHQNAIALLLLAVGFILLPVHVLSPGAQDLKTHTEGQAGNEAKTYTLAYGGLECEACYELAKAIYSEAFSRLGHRVRIISLPSERSLIETNAGNFDGEVSRVQGFDFENRYPNLMLVPEQLSTVNVAAFAVDPKAEFDGWPGLARSSDFIAYRRGDKIIEARLSRYADPSKIIPAKDLVHGARLLVSGRAAVLITSPEIFAGVLQMEEFRDAAIHRIGDMESVDAYPVLHIDHADLAPKLAGVLREMKRDGSYYRIFEDPLSHRVISPAGGKR